MISLKIRLLLSLAILANLVRDGASVNSLGNPCAPGTGEDEDGWITIQRRGSGPLEDFYRGWDDYVKGFGCLQGNFWIGLEVIRALTQNGDQELKIQLEDFEGNKKYAKYSNFSISDASDFYRLSIGGFSPDSTVEDDMNSIYPWAVHNGMRFSTKDKDNDNYDENCAVLDGGGWWFNKCASANLNGLYREKGEAENGIMWWTWKGEFYSLAKTEMKIRARK